jgi:hypothetical protein
MMVISHILIQTIVHSHHVFVKIPRQVQLAEVGPRFEMKRKHSRIIHSAWSATDSSHSVRNPTRDDRTVGGRAGMGLGALCANIEKTQPTLRSRNFIWQDGKFEARADEKGKAMIPGLPSVTRQFK